MSYGDKRDYRKIDLFLAYQNSTERYWLYKASTTWAKTCKEAKQRFYDAHYPAHSLYDIKARFAK